MPHSKGVMEMLNTMTKEMYGMTLTEALNDNICVKCKQDTSELDGIDKREFLISGLCPKCFDNLTNFDEASND